MNYTIRCEVCSEVIGQIHKDTVSEDDREMYRQSVVCGNGHSGSIELVES